MTGQFLLEAPIALTPVLLFLGTLLYFDSYRLVSVTETAQTLSAGVVLAVAAYFVNGLLLSALPLDYESYSRVIGPILEECLKAAALMVLFWRNRVGFMIDAAIMGFAVGTGFALFENVYFLYGMHDANMGVWIIRGFGTALMHGGATAIFATLSQSLVERRGESKTIYFVPGLAAAIVIHAIFNELGNSPTLAMAIVLLGLPPLFFIIFTKSEHAVHQWLVKDYASHEQLLEEINSGDFKHSEAGRFILVLAMKFDKAIVESMFSYLKLHTQLVLRAEQISLARERNEKIVPRHEDREDLLRLDALEKRIGRAALMALWPHLHFSRRELWEIHQLHER